MTHHELLIKPEFFDAIADGTKTFEVRRKRGRTFTPGDTVTLLRYDVPPSFPMERITRVIGYVLDGADIPALNLIEDDVVVFSLTAPTPAISFPPYLKEPSL